MGAMSGKEATRSSFETTLDTLELIMKNKKSFSVFNGSLRNIVEGGHRFFKFIKWVIRKSLKNPVSLSILIR